MFGGSVVQGGFCGNHPTLPSLRNVVQNPRAQWDSDNTIYETATLDLPLTRTRSLHSGPSLPVLWDGPSPGLFLSLRPRLPQVCPQVLISGKLPWPPMQNCTPSPAFLPLLCPQHWPLPRIRRTHAFHLVSVGPHQSVGSLSAGLVCFVPHPIPSPQVTVASHKGAPCWLPGGFKLRGPLTCSAQSSRACTAWTSKLKHSRKSSSPLSRTSYIQINGGWTHSSWQSHIFQLRQHWAGTCPGTGEEGWSHDIPLYTAEERKKKGEMTPSKGVHSDGKCDSSACGVYTKWSWFIQPVRFSLPKTTHVRPAELQTQIRKFKFISRDIFLTFQTNL